MRSRYLTPRFFFGLIRFTALVACGSEDEPVETAGKVGASCDPAVPTACESGLECTALEAGGNVCSYPLGAACQPNNTALANGGCALGAECSENAEHTQPVCLIAEGGECDPEGGLCGEGLTCAEVEDGTHRCFGEVVLRGQVSDASDKSPIEEAHVMAVDEEGVAVTDVARTDAMGNYELPVPVERHEDGTPVNTPFTLRAAAQDYQAFPSGVRVALPIDVSTAVAEERSYVVENALTAIDLIPLEAAERSTISGSIVGSADSPASAVAGVLVVAAGDEGAFSGVSDKVGSFTIFNVPAGSYELKGYAADLQLESQTVSVSDEPLDGVLINELDELTAEVLGNIQIVNAPGESVTSVILVVEETFDPNLARGEVPRGLRAPRSGEPNVTGDFTITGVPVGRYVVLAAYENDALVRDPDTNIAGTDFVTIEVTAETAAVALTESFKVTEGLTTVSPGVNEPEAVTEKPDLEWADDSSEDWYDLRVFDALGNEVWSKLEIPGVSGSPTVSVPYEGPLDPGMYYQFRVSSWRQPGQGEASPISTTEDLRGVFFLPAD
jgi:hypothetical protein